MTVSIPIQAIEITPGSRIAIHNLSWQDFEGLLLDLGEKRHNRIAYYQGTLEIMSPLVLHERPHRIIAYIIITILEAQGRDWEDFGSTTFKYPDIAGVEPDTCFYIQNANQVKGCTQMDLSIYPPPDLAIECDVTSKTTLNAYTVLGVPEVWIYSNSNLNIYILQTGKYIESVFSPTFPNLPIKELIPQLTQKAINDGTSQMLRELKNLLRQFKILE
ncbi:MAG TPA: Uma2 family endonuclease [Nostocaceae cyanobacterium]|nr:Uma2 family endonuclease [Nostocaceae cyanobacterium]